MAEKQASADSLEESGLSDLITGSQYVDTRAEPIHAGSISERPDPFDAE